MKEEMQEEKSLRIPNEIFSYHLESRILFYLLEIKKKKKL